MIRFLTLAKLARKDHTLERLAAGDKLFGTAARSLLTRDGCTPAALDYITHKKRMLHASYFRQRYGRDYWTGQRRRVKAIEACDPMDDFNYVGSRHHY